MKKIRKISLIALLIFMGALSIFVISFSNQLNCYFVRYSNFKQIAINVFVQLNMSHSDQEILLQKIERSKQRVRNLFGAIVAKPTIIAGTDNKRLKRFGLPMNKKSGITYKTLYGNFIVIAIDGLNEDVIAHEMVHAELAARIGWPQGLKIPVWFDEGLATQVDFRPQYSEEVWKEETNNGKRIPNFAKLASGKQFFVAELTTCRFHYTVSKHEVKKWLGKVGSKGLMKMIDKLRNGNDFYRSYHEVAEGNPRNE
jgi:hypothetical protein